MHARRALLYVPGSDWRKMDKATGLNADSVCLDLEDGVAANRKAEARGTLARALGSLDFRRAERLARINAIGTELEVDDLAAILPAQPDGVVIPKVASADQVRWAGEHISAFEQAQGWPEGRIALIAMIESARGVLNVAAIAGADPRLQALVFGAEDYAADVGATRTREGSEVLYARSAIVAAAAAFDLQAIDLLYLDFHDVEGLRAEAQRGAQLGYAGMQTIHPNQIGPVQEVFTPDDASIAYAVRVVQANAAHQSSGAGAFALDGKMVDSPIVKSAERVLTRARAAGKIP
ncbi:MAG: HpcH/HpaI aldolase/citrate lyase family protein [Acidobacteriota bacterium]